MTQHQPITPATWDALDKAEKIAAIKALVGAGQTCRQIGIALHCTKNTVLSFAHRNKIRLACRAPAVRAKQANGKARDTVVFKTLKPLPAATWAPHREPVTLLDLDSDSCRWPVGEFEGARQLFCGDHAVGGSYCARHGAMRHSCSTDSRRTPSKTGKPQ